jgi:hypothetical protein
MHVFMCVLLTRGRGRPLGHRASALPRVRIRHQMTVAVEGLLGRGMGELRLATGGPREPSGRCRVLAGVCLPSPEIPRRGRPTSAPCC